MSKIYYQLYISEAKKKALEILKACEEKNIGVIDKNVRLLNVNRMAKFKKELIPIGDPEYCLKLYKDNGYK